MSRTLFEWNNKAGNVINSISNTFVALLLYCVYVLYVRKKPSLFNKNILRRGSETRLPLRRPSDYIIMCLQLHLASAVIHTI